MKRSLALASMVLVAAVGSGAWLHWHWTHDPLPIGAQPVDVDIMPGESLRRVAQQFADKGILRHAWDLTLYTRLERASGGLRAGEYEIEPGTTVAGLLDLLRSGKVVMHSLTLVEGWTFKQILAAVEAEPNLDHTLAGLDAAAQLKKLGFESASPEGELLPDTYQFPRGTSDVSFLRRAHEAQQQYLATEWNARPQGLPYKTPYDALIMASIVEKETGVAAERARVAGVFVSRLRKGMRLQTDPTVIYGLGDGYDGTIHTRDLQTDTPYNSYTRAGLPPTPICLPGHDSIVAALHPLDTGELYFVATGNGGHHFSKTLEEHNEAVKAYLQHLRSQGAQPAQSGAR